MLLKIGATIVGLGIGTYAASKSNESKERKEKEQRQRDVQMAKEEEKEKELKILSSVKNLKEFEQSWGKRLTSLIIVDSNIWMQQEYSRFFRDLEWVMKRFSSNIKMSSIQFDEIVNLKDLPYSNPKSKLARCALARIEDFQKTGLIEIIPMKFEANKYAYADPDIIKFLVDSSREYPVMTLVSDDRELRIRTNQIVKDKSKSEFLSITGQDLEKEVNDYRNNLTFVEPFMEINLPDIVEDWTF